MLGGGVAALQEPRPAVHLHQTLVVVVVDGRAQHPQLQLLGAGVVDVLEGGRKKRSEVRRAEKVEVGREVGDGNDPSEFTG